MHRNKKIIVISLIISSVVSLTLLVHQIQFNIQTSQTNYQSLTIDFLKNQLWDEEYSSFYAYQSRNGSYTEKGLQKYTSFNFWTVEAFLDYSKAVNDYSIFNQYGIETLNFLISHLYNTTNGGFYHWVERNGSHPAMEDLNFNNSVYQIATYQAWALLTLIHAYNYTSNSTYINVAERVAKFLTTTLWDSTYGGFYASYLPFYDEYIETYKYTWYLAWSAVALMSYYQETGNSTYMNYVNSTLEFMIAHLWDNMSKAFIYRSFKNGTSDMYTRYYQTDQTAAILAFSKAAKITGNTTFIDEYLQPMLNFTIKNLWNAEVGQFFTSIEDNQTNPDLTNRPSDLSMLLLALHEGSKILNGTEFYREIISFAISNMISVVWDNQEGGFFRKFYINGAVIDLDKWTIEQVIPLSLFCIYRNDMPVDTWVILPLTIVWVSTTSALTYFYFKFKKQTTLTRKKLKN